MKPPRNQEPINLPNTLPPNLGYIDYDVVRNITFGQVGTFKYDAKIKAELIILKRKKSDKELLALYQPLNDEALRVCQIERDSRHGIVNYIITTLSVYLKSREYIGVEYEFELFFYRPVTRPLWKYSIIGLSGDGMLILETNRRKLMEQLAWDGLDATTVQECLSEFKNALLIQMNKR